MIKLKGIRIALHGTMSMVMVGLLAMFLAPLMVAETARAADKTPVKTWKDITLIYTTDIKGKIEPCG